MKEGVDVRAELAERIVRAELSLLELRPIGMSLEEVYLRAISSEDA